MINEYVVDPHAGWLGANGNLVFLRDSKDDEGGRWFDVEDYYLYSSQTVPRYTGITMGDGSRITLGGVAKADYGVYSYYASYLPDYLFENPADKAYNLLYYGFNVQDSVAAANFTGSGEIDFATATGAGSINSGTGSTPNPDGPESPIIIVGNTANTEYISVYDYILHTDDPWNKTKTTIIKSSEDLSAYGIRAAGDFTVLGDMSAHIFAYSSYATLLAYHDATSNDANASVDISSGNTANAAGYRVGTFTLENNFNGFLYSESNEFLTQHYNAANYNNNTIGAYGIWSSGSVLLNGQYNGAIHTEANGTSLTNVGIAGKQDSNKSANANNNTISAIGIRGTNIVLNDFFSSALTGTNRDASIHTEVKDTLIQANSSGGDGSSANATGNVINSIGISGSSLTINGLFEGDLYGEVSELRIDNWGGNSSPGGNNSVYLCGIYLTGALNANRNFAGNFDLKYETVNAPNTPSADPAYLETNLYGVWANTITVDGSIRSNINISIEDDYSTYNFSSEYIAGIRADVLTASAYEGNITINNLSSNTLAAGLIADAFHSGNDSTYDISGDITVTGSGSSASGKTVGILGSTTEAMDIRISGDVISHYKQGGTTYLQENNTYAIFAGWLTSRSESIRYDFDDRVEVAAGAYVEGAIDLQNGQNTLIVDSNARIHGDVLSDLGKLNLEFVLNDQAFGGVVSSAAASQTAILRAGSNAVLSSTCNVTLNLNSAESTTYTIYQGTLGSQAENTGWYARAINFKYQGITTEFIEKYGIIVPSDTDLIKVTSKGMTGRITVGNSLELKDANDNVVFKLEAVIVGNQVQIQVQMPDGYDVAQPFAEPEDLKLNYDREDLTAKLSWTDPDGKSGESYEVEYRIVTNGTPGKSIVQMVSNSKTTITLKNIESNQTVEWRVRQNLGAGDNISEWRTWGTDPADIATTEDAVLVCTQPTDAKYVAGESAASAVSVLVWDAGEYSEGLQYYTVQYFQSSVRLDESTMDETFWDNVASVKKQVTNNQLQVSGLNNTEYFYWRVQAIDLDGNESGWTTGEMFRSYNDDITPPVFGQKPTSDVKYVIPADPGSGTDPFTVTADTLDLILNWKAATDDRSGVSRYTVSWKLSSDTDWSTVDISVTDENQTDYKFVLSDYADLVANGSYQWRITASDYVGRTSTAQTGTWTTDTTGPTFDTGSVKYVSVWENGSKPLSITVAWDAAEDDEDGSGLYYYQLRYKSSTSGSWTVVNLRTSQLSTSLTLTNSAYYNYELSAFDKAGNESSIASGIWYGDSVAPTLDDTSAIAVSNSYDPATKKSVLVFDWSTATDTSLGPVSGFAYYELAYYDENDVRHVLGTYDEGTLTASITVGKGGQISGLDDGYYNWSITAYDNAGNSNEYFGSDFLIDTQAPTGSFNSPSLTGHATTESTSTTQDTVLPAFGGTPVVVGDPTYTWVITDIWVTFTFNGNFTDNSGEVYYILQVSDTATFTGDNTHEFTTSQDSLTLDSTNGYGAGALVGDGRLIYWRIQAMDSSGNRTGAWTLGTPFYFVSETTGEYTPLEDTTIPTTITGATVTVTDKNTVNTVTLAWNPSYDLFGVESYEITYSAKGVSSKTITISATDISTTLKFQNGTADGLYSWSVRAVDYVGNKSEWFSGSQFLVDTINPVLNPSSFKIISVQGAKDIGFTWAAAKDANLYYYQIEVTAPNGEVSYVNTADTSYWIYNQPDGLYSFCVRAVDLLGNTSEWSDPRVFMVETKADPGSTFETAAALGFTGSRETMVGGSDPGDMFKLTLTKAASVTITLADVETLEGKTSGIKVNLYDSNGKKLKSLSIKSGTKSLEGLLLDVSGSSTDYYVEVVSASGDANVAKYTISATKQDFADPTTNTNWANATAIPLTDGKGSFDDGWVGFGDAADYYTFTSTDAGSITIDFSGIDSATSLKVSLYVLVDGKYKKMASTTVKSDMDNIFKKSVLAQSGEYYLVVESGDKGKGKYNSYYDFTVNDEYFPTATDNNIIQKSDTKTLVSGGMNTDVSGWVGFGDATNCYLLKATGPGIIDFSFSNLDAGTKIKVSLYDLNGKKIKSYTVTDKKPLHVDDMLLKGDCYLVVDSGDKGKGKNNTNYLGSIVYNAFPTEATSNNTQTTATSVNFATVGTSEVAEAGDWVGYGDNVDFFSFELDANGRVDLDLALDTAGLRVGKEVKVKLYSEDGKLLKLDSNLMSNELEAGKYSVSVEVSKPEKYWTGYDLSVTKLA